VALDGYRHIAERPTDPIGQPPASTGTTYVNKNNTYDIAIGGIPFFLAPNAEHPYKRETVQYRKQQIDMQKEPGEQTLTSWWLRSQSSFHYGAGIRFEEPIQGETVAYRFNKSAGVDVFNIGKVTLLPDVTLKASATGTPLLIGGYDSVNSADVLFQADGSTLTRMDGGSNSTVTWGGSGNILDVTTDGQSYYAANATGIYKGTLAGGTGTSIFTFPSAVGTVTNVKLAWVKQRLIVGVNNYIYEVTPITSYSVVAGQLANNVATLKTATAHNFSVGSQVTVASVSTGFNGTFSVTAVPSITEFSYYHNYTDQQYATGLTGTAVLASNNNLPIYAHPNTNWIWTGICEGPNAIYIAGYAGNSSTVYRLSLDTSGQVPLLTKALTAADMPQGELIYCLGAYVGKYMVFGTNKGIRVGQIDTSGFVSSGYVTYGPLTVVTNGYDPATGTNLTGGPCYNVAFNDRYAYCTVSNYIDSDGTGTAMRSGLVKIDLSRDISVNQMAYATHLQVPSSNDAVDVAIYGRSNKLAIGVTGVGTYLQAATLVSSGYIQTGLIRYLTLEDKHFKLVKLLAQNPVVSNIKLSTVLDDGTVTDIITADPNFNLSLDIGTNLQSERPSLALKFTIYPTADLTQATTFNGYQLKALPAVHRTRMISLPLLNFDFEADRYNMMTGYEYRAAERLQLIEALEGPGNVVTLQDFTSNETVQGVIESIAFQRVSAPNRRFKGLGGILYLQFRTL
jgi:hypothetical protein